MIRHGGITAIHQSDPECLAALHAKVNGAHDESEAAKIGTAVHAAAEALTQASTLGEDFDAHEVARDAINMTAIRLDMLPRSFEEAVGIMDECLSAENPIRFFVEDGSTVYPEWKWALDANFDPIEVDQQSGAPLDPSRTIVAAGTVDRLQVFHDTKRIVVADYKSIRRMLAQWEVAGLWQARLYAFAVLQHFPGMREVTFRIVNLRHRYWIEETFARGDPWERTTRERLSYEMERRVAAEATDHWPHTLSEGCQWCPILFKCPEVKRAVAQGEKIDPAMSDENLARQALAIPSLGNRIRRAAEARYEKHGPLDMGDGSVLGGSVRQEWQAELSYEETMAELRIYGMTPQQEQEHFRFCAKHHFGSRVKKVLHELLGKDAKSAIDAGGLVSPIAKESFGRWWPDGKPD